MFRMWHLKPFTLISFTALAIFMVEGFIMLLLDILPSLPPPVAGILDAAILTSLISPILFFFIFRQMNSYINQCLCAEEELKKVNEKLEHRVLERTKKLQEEIVKRSSAQQASRRAVEMAARFGRILDDSLNEIYIFDAETFRFIQLNRGARENLGYSMEELRNLSAPDLKPEFNRESFAKLLAPLRTGEKERIQFTTVHRRKDGSMYPIETHVQLSTFESAPVFVGIILDLTERKRMEEEKATLEAQLRQAQKLETIGTLAGGIAHDFNNLLTPILGYSDMLLNEIPLDSPANIDLQQVVKAAKRAKDLVKQILTFSRHRQVEQERNPVQIHLVVKEALKLLRATLPTTIEIRQNIDSNCGAVLSDPTQIHQVLMNLCTNAYHAMDRDKSGGVLKVSLGCVELDAEFIRLHPNLNEGIYVRLTVSDTGHGMDNKTMERIFEPFFTTKGVGEGTGLGLSVVHGIVVNHDGEIIVESEPGKGTTFHVYLPRAYGDIEKEAPGEEIIPRGKEHILFIDDNDTIAHFGKQMLERLGYKVTATTSSVEALETFRTDPHRFDLLITDQTMPNMTGVELAVELLHIRPELPIILVTGFSSTITPEKAKKMGIREYLMKPIIARDIAKAIRRVLDHEQKT